jgi:toxin ParE1/3/4
MAEYRLSRRAQRDLDEIYDYTVVQWSLPQAMRYSDSLEAALAELAHMDVLRHLWPQRRTGATAA